MVKDEDENLKKTIISCDVDHIYDRKETKPYLISSSFITILVKLSIVIFQLSTFRFTIFIA